MKPITKAEVRIVKINKSIRKLTKKEIQWAYTNALFHKCRLLKSGKASCLDCGHTWYIKEPASSLLNILLDVNCPNCNVLLEIVQNRIVNFSDIQYVNYIQTHKEHQVIRFFMVIGQYVAGKPANLFHIEKSRFYIDKNNTEQVISCTRQDGWYGTRWGMTMEFRHHNAIDKYLCYTKLIYPIKGILKKIRRNGYNGHLHEWHPHYFFHKILNYSIAETLLKAKRIDLFDYYLDGKNSKAKIEKYWSAIKLCLKYKYPIGKVNMSIYFDYMGDLSTHNKDYTNVKFACPKNLIKEHNKYIEKERKARLKLKLSNLRKKIAKHNKIYLKEKSKFFELKFISKNIEITPFYNVQQVLDESDLFGHCAYSQEYHLKDDCLLFSARVNNKPVETVDFNIEKLKVEQSRGAGNEPSIYNRKIVQLMNKNIPAIRAILMQKSKPKHKLKKAV